MNAISTKLCNNKYKLASVLGVVGGMLSPMAVFANDGGSSGNVTAGMTTALQTAFNNVQTDVTSIITTALPYALAIMGISLALTIGIKIFKRFTGKS